MTNILPSFAILCLLASVAGAAPAALPQSGLKLHLDAANAVVSRKNQVTALNDSGPLALRIPARDATKGFGGILNTSALNGHPAVAIQNNGFRLGGKKAAVLNPSGKGFTLVLVAKAVAPSSTGAFNLVRKQGTATVKDTGYRVQFDPKGNHLLLFSIDDENNRRSIGLPPPKDWFVLVMNANIASGKLDYSLNGVAFPKPVFSRGKPADFANDEPFDIGVGPNGTMEFAELAFYDRPLSADEQQQTVATLASKYGIALEKPITPADWLIPGNGFEPASFPLSRADQELIKHPDGQRLIGFQGGKLVTSTDGGKTFPSSGDITVFTPGTLPSEMNGKPPAICLFTITSSGAWIALAQTPNVNPFDRQVFNRETVSWNPDITGKAAIYVTRSTDQGKTWSPPTLVFRPEIRCSFPPRNIIEAAPGVLVIAAQYSTSDPGHAITVLRSTDDGKTWQPTGATFEQPVITKGLHDGIFEPSMIRLNDSDKTVWILFRTNLGYFWESRSTDQGKTWSRFSRTNIQASSAPGTVLRLSDNRIVLIYNPWRASDGTLPAMKEGISYSQILTSWHRRELILITSRDEGKTWSAPLIIARHPDNKGRSQEFLSYVGAWEYDGYLHIATGQGNLQARVPTHKLP